MEGNDVQNRLHGCIRRQHIVNSAIKEVCPHDKHDAFESIGEVQIRARLMQRRAPDSDGLAHDRLPTESVDSRMKAHSR